MSIPIADSDIRFPYYGQTLCDLAAGKTAGEAAAVIIKGNHGDVERRVFIGEILTEVQRRHNITDLQVAKIIGAETISKGPLNWTWLQGVLQAIDIYVPLASAAAIALATNDVYQYLENIGIRDEIEMGVRQALIPEVPTVVVAHSLGTVVAYNLLRRDGAAQRWQVPLLLTLGSPLAVTAIRKKLAPNRCPTCVGQWINARDARDVVALYPLDADHFPLDVQIINKRDVDNPTPNRHGISGYISDPEIAKALHDAVVA
ncbi:MAG: hypothetical protein ABI612_10790 [Betaproteobacteria bacterium]